MKIFVQTFLRRLQLATGSAAWLVVGASGYGGSWQPMVNQPPNGFGTMLLLSDGTVLAHARIPAPTFPFSVASKQWFRIHPTPAGHYVGALVLPAADMHDSRDAFTSAVLRDGRVLVAGGEYGTGGATSEIYDPVNDAWTVVPVPAGLITQTVVHDPAEGENRYGFSDAGCKILPDGRVMVAPVFPLTGNGTIIFDPTSNSWSAGPTSLANQNEASWVKLSDDSILTVDKNSTTSERFVPALNQWVLDTNLPVMLYDQHVELGPAFLLPDGRAFFLGGTGKTALYTPSPLGGSNPGSWQAGPAIPNGLVSADAPAVMLPSGNVLCAVSVGWTNGPTTFVDFLPGNTGSFIVDTSPPFSPSLTVDDPQGDVFLPLPDGTILFSHVVGNALGGGVFIYTPDNPPLAAGKPKITRIEPRTDGSYHLIGTGFNGISEGAGYGDDAQMDSAYPLVRLTDPLGLVYYARTYNWSSTSVMTGNKLVSVDFVLPSPLPPNSYALQVVANGNASDSIGLSHVVYVDKNNSCLTVEDLPGEFRDFALANPPPGLYYGTFDCLSITLDPPFPDRPPGYPSNWPWGPDAIWDAFPNPPPNYPAGWPWPPIDPKPQTFGLGGPFRVVGDAVSSASSGDRIQIKSNNYNEHLTINKPLTIGASGGSVFIGKP